MKHQNIKPTIFWKDQVLDSKCVQQRVFSLQQQILLPLDGRVVLKYIAYEDQCLGAWVNFSNLVS